MGFHSSVVFLSKTLTQLNLQKKSAKVKLLQLSEFLTVHLLHQATTTMAP